MPCLVCFLGFIPFFLGDEAACRLRMSAERHAMRELPGPLRPILGIYEAEDYDLVTMSFGVTRQTIPRQASKHQTKHHLSGQIQKVRPGFPSAAALASLAPSHPGEGLNG